MYGLKSSEFGTVQSSRWMKMNQPVSIENQTRVV